jgi:hypothetical protein
MPDIGAIDETSLAPLLSPREHLTDAFGKKNGIFVTYEVVSKIFRISFTIYTAVVAAQSTGRW